MTPDRAVHRLLALALQRRAFAPPFAGPRAQRRIFAPPLAGEQRRGGGPASRGAKSLRHNADHPSLPPLLFLTDRTRVPDPLAVVQRLPPGCGVILRDYEAPDRRGLAEALAALCRQRRLLFLVGGDAALARAVRADGVHWRAADLRDTIRSRSTARRGLRLATAAVHDAHELALAGRAGADAALLGSVFPTRSHADRAVLGPWRTAALARTSRLPLYALGGITPATAARFPWAERFAGFAAIGALSN